MENKHAEFIRTADIIIKKGDDCRNVDCSKCPASYIRKINNYDSCSDVWYMELRTKLQWFINWKKENEVKEMSEKAIFENEQEYEEFYDRCYSRDYLIMKKNVKKAGYIRKSLLQQKVEEAEEIFDKFYVIAASPDYVCDNKDNLIIALYDIIQLFKEDHPEFKS